MADLLSGSGRPRSSVRDRNHCPACFGALPPDTEAACSYCGTGTPPGLAVLQPLVVDEQHTMTLERLAELPEIAPRPGERWLLKPDPPVERSGWVSTLRSWARWPNA